MNKYIKSFATGRTYFFIPLFLLCIFSAHARAGNLPPRSISGKITDSATGQPLAMVSIRVKGKSDATTSATDGSYYIHAEDEDVLIFSYVGYSDASVKVGIVPAYT